MKDKIKELIEEYNLVLENKSFSGYVKDNIEYFIENLKTLLED